MKLVKEHINRFERGLDPKAAMGTGIFSSLKKYAAEKLNIYADNLNNYYLDILDHLTNYVTITDVPERDIFINWLLQHVNIKDFDDRIIEGLENLQWNLVPFLKKLPDDNFSFIKNDNNYTLITDDWNNFVDYFQKNSSRNESYTKYIEDTLSGDSYEYFEYNYSQDFKKKLDVYDLQMASPLEFKDVILELKKLKISNEQLETIQQAKFASTMFDFIWEQAKNNEDWQELKRRIIKAAGETLVAGNEQAAFEDITKQLIVHFDIEQIKNSENLKFQISEKGLNKFVYAYYLNDSKIRFIEKDIYGDFDLNVFHECFDNAINT